MNGPHVAHRPTRSLTVLVALLTLLAAACTAGVDTGAESAEGASGEAATADGGDSGGGDADTVSLWYLQDHEAMITAAIERFNEEFPDITVDAQGVENDPYKTRLQTAMGTTARPDVFHSWGGGWLQQFV
ncbi:MAG TPA: extracellular solute-binding protein, partial [Euzebyales bacterium]|nr:extracellular solute-binding protein [Euzebyales bacterium]